MNKVLIVAGQTATGKTSFAVELAHKFNGELVSADSRMVYKGMDIITGKDRDKIDVPIWLYDLVSPEEKFSVSLWRESALKAIQNIQKRNKLPIVVGGTGLYLRSLTDNLNTLDVPRNLILRQQLSSKSTSDLFDQLHQISPIRASNMNQSDRQNPRRLIRYIEIAEYNKKTQPPSHKLGEGQGVEYKTVVLTCPPTLLKHRISERVSQRISSGAILELQHLASIFDIQSSSFTACGYKTLLKSQNPDDWIRNEYQYARRQKVFFQKYFPENIVDVSTPSWRQHLLDIIIPWVAM